ncbi:MAG: hypothetical protein OXI43_23220 [Candidatus Poribacteria bacterium]|nr:hypothetical protein [Candidatus Poribacteria bacterium]
MDKVKNQEYGDAISLFNEAISKIKEDPKQAKGYAEIVYRNSAMAKFESSLIDFADSLGFNLSIKNFEEYKKKFNTLNKLIDYGSIFSSSIKIEI